MSKLSVFLHNIGPLVGRLEGALKIAVPLLPIDAAEKEAIMGGLNTADAIGQIAAQAAAEVNALRHGNGQPILAPTAPTAPVVITAPVVPAAPVVVADLPPIMAPNGSGQPIPVVVTSDPVVSPPAPVVVADPPSSVMGGATGPLPPVAPIIVADPDIPAGSGVAADPAAPVIVPIDPVNVGGVGGQLAAGPVATDPAPVVAPIVAPPVPAVDPATINAPSNAPPIIGDGADALAQVQRWAAAHGYKLDPADPQ